MTSPIVADRVHVCPDHRQDARTADRRQRDEVDRMTPVQRAGTPSGRAVTEDAPPMVSPNFAASA